MNFTLTAKTPAETLTVLAAECDRRAEFIQARMGTARTKKESARMATECATFVTFAQFIRAIKVETPAG